MAGKEPYRVKSISELHQFRGLYKPEHPLISVVDVGSIKEVPTDVPTTLVTDFYIIGLKRNFGKVAKIKFGQQAFDFDEGVLSFMSPGRVFTVEFNLEEESHATGWMLLVHPDFLWNTALAKGIRQYGFFDYSINEALFLSEKEEITITQFIKNIEQEYHSNIDKFSHGIIISQLEALLNYSDRFYQRQFITRRITNHQILDRLTELLESYFEGDGILKEGLPTVGYVAGKLNVSADYLSGLLKTLTGLNTQQHIHQTLIEKAKEKLSTTRLTVSEIAYQLGFEHPQSFNKLFKTKTSLSPLAFRQSVS